MRDRIINKRSSRPVTSVPHGKSFQTGISFRGVQVCLLVPSSLHPPTVVKEFVKDFRRMHKDMSTLQDMREDTIRLQAELQEQIDG